MKRLYRALLKLYPARFREEYAEPMERQFDDEYREAEGWGCRAWLGLRALVDFARTAPGEAAREIWQDVRHGARVYRRRSVTTALALAALALAIGATTGIFSVLNALLIRSLPFREPARLVELWQAPLNAGAGRAEFQAWQGRSPYLAEAAGYTTNELNLSLSRGSARVRVSETTANFLRMLGTEPEFGRGFAGDEDIPGRDGVAVIGYGLWQQVFGGDPRVLGSTIRLNGAALTVIGVAPRGVDYPEKTAIWTPTMYDLGRIPKSDAYFWQTIGRLKPGVGMAQASGMFQAEVERHYAGQARPPRMKGYSNDPHLFSLNDRLAGPVRSASLVLMALVAFVLLIACANVAHLLLSRTTERRQELAIRAALGASRARLMQQLVTEATVLTAAAAVAGLAVAHWTARLAASAQPAQLAAREYTLLDWRVILFALGLAVLTGVVFGVLPASLIYRMQPGQDVIRTQSGLRGSGAGRMRGVLIALQAALTVALAAGSFSMGRSFVKLMGTDLGFHTDHVATLNVSFAGTRSETDGRERQYYNDALERLRAAPGVESAAVVSYLPLISKLHPGGLFKLDSGEQGPVSIVIAASPGYFRTMGTEIIEGREFTQNDRAGAEPVVVISEDLERSFGRGSLAGRKLNLAFGGAPRMATIVGVVRSERYSGPEAKGWTQVFRPIEQAPSGSVTFVARVRGDPEPYLAVCRDAVQEVDPEVPVYDVKTLDQRLADTLARPRFYTTAILFLAGFALLLAVAGTYGAATYAVTQRTHEIGVRIAVGASLGSVRGMLFRQSMLSVGAGMLAGVCGAAGLGRFLQHLIAIAEPTGVWICIAAAFVMATATAAAVWTATNRIVRMDPTAALRVE
jgi:putative ABC transport system permease protein